MSTKIVLHTLFPNMKNYSNFTDGICLEDESECKNDGQCCSKLCQLEAPHNSTKTDLMSFCVRKTKGKYKVIHVQ